MNKKMAFIRKDSLGLTLYSVGLRDTQPTNTCEYRGGVLLTLILTFGYHFAITGWVFYLTTDQVLPWIINLTFKSSLLSNGSVEWLAMGLTVPLGLALVLAINYSVGRMAYIASWSVGLCIVSGQKNPKTLNEQFRFALPPQFTIPLVWGTYALIGLMLYPHQVLQVVEILGSFILAVAALILSLASICIIQERALQKWEVNLFAIFVPVSILLNLLNRTAVKVKEIYCRPVEIVD